MDAIGRPWTFATTGTVDAPIGQVWAIVGNFAELAAWHPRIISCEVDGSGIGALRTVDLGDRVAVERLDVLDDAQHVIEYSVVKGKPLTVGVSGRIKLGVAADDVTAVEWLTTIPNRPGSAELVPAMMSYYASRVEDIRAAVARQRAAQSQPRP